MTTQNEEIPRDERERELRALLQSGLVRENTGLHALLSYLGRKALENGDSLKEYTIGVEALGKPNDYDPRLDPTVRVDISKLRAKLREYYHNEGAPRAVHLEIPRGGYHLAFVKAPGAPAARKGRLPVRALLVVAAVAGCLTAGWWLLSLRHRQTAATPLAPELQALWAPFLKGSVPTVISYGTPLFLKLDRTFYRDPRVNSPEETGDSPALESVVRALKPSESRWVVNYTGVGEAEGLFMITRLLASQGVPLSVRGSAHLGWEDMKGKNVILLGSHKTTSQIPELPVTAKYRVASDPPRIVNMRPAGEEPADYRTVRPRPNAEILEEFALVSLYEGLLPGTHLMVLSCSSTEGTGAAAEYVTRADTVGDLLREMGVDPQAPELPPAFQVVVKASMKGGVPVQLSHVAHHVLAP